jgi:hypothetical protein
VVFSYIRSPIIKHRTGIIEWFYFNKKTDVLIQNNKNNNFFSMLAEIVYIDHHSMSIYEHLSDNAFKLQWIPIDNPNINHKDLTIKLLSNYSVVPDDIKEWFLNLLPKNVSTGFKKDCVDRLLQITPGPLIVKSLEIDQVLYDRATTANFEPTDYPFRIAELLEKGHTQQQAEIIADQEVYNGTWQEWFKPKKINK